MLAMNQRKEGINMATLKRGIRFSCIALLLLSCCALLAQDGQRRVRNIVLVHGAWADGSGWKGVYDILVKDGYNVSIVQEPETFQSRLGSYGQSAILQIREPCFDGGHDATKSPFEVHRAISYFELIFRSTTARQLATYC
jgi:hypothetical protein